MSVEPVHRLPIDAPVGSRAAAERGGLPRWPPPPTCCPLTGVEHQLEPAVLHAGVLERALHLVVRLVYLRP